jgi:hypothetical protein
VTTLFRTTIVCCSLVLGPFAGGPKEPVELQTVKETSRHALSTPVFIAFVETQCDARGNLYFHVDEGDHNRAEILQLTSTGDRGKLFQLSAPYADSTDTLFSQFSGNTGWQCKHSGRQSDRKAATLLCVFNFGSDGQTKDPTRLSIPDGVLAKEFAVFARGEILFSGYYDTIASPSLRSNSYVAVLGPFGPDCDLRRWGLKLAARGGRNGKKRAIIATARKLAVLLHHLWVSGEVYEPLHNSGRVPMSLAA